MKLSIILRFFLLFNLISGVAFSQTLIINEVSNGPSGLTEYVEFVVVDETAVYDCSGSAPPCIDIRGWIYDDNTGYHGSSGVASGAARFSNHPLWSCVPLGTVILLYNGLDPNPDIAGEDFDITDCSISIALDNPTYFEFTATTPGDVSCNYPTTGWGTDPSPDWSNVAMANGGDCARLVDLNGCEVFSLCYGSADQNQLIYFSGSGGDDVWYFNDGSPTDQANWSEGCAGDISACGSNEQTPGLPNNAANAAYIAQFNNGCAPIAPIVTTAVSVDAGCGCTGSATATSTGSIAGYTHEWYDDATDLPIGQSTATATNLCGGTYYVIGTSSIGCEDTATVTVNSAATFTLSSATTPPLCFEDCNGTATITTTGGSTPFSYVWSSSTSTTATATDLCTGTHTVTVTDGSGCAATETFTLTEPSELSASIISTDAKCFGGSDGSLALTISGGTSDYINLWDDPASSSTQNLSGVPMGTYTVTITDFNNCVITATGTIGQPTEITASTSITEPKCFGSSDGAIDLTVSDGTGPYTFLWSDASNTTTEDIGNLADGTYSVTITDANNCVFNTSTTLTEPLDISITTIPNNPTCFGSLDGGVNLMLSGGTTPYDFLWSDNSTGQSLSNIGAGNYTLQITDANDCIQNASATLVDPDPMTITETVIDVNCSITGQACISIVGGATPYTQIWNDGNAQTGVCATNLVSNTYQVDVTDANNCTQSLSVFVDDLTPNITISVDSSNITCNGLSDGSVTLSINSPETYTVDWTSTNSFTGSGDVISNLTQGTYSYVFTDANGCVLQSDIELTEPTALTTTVTTDSVSCSLLCDGVIYASTSGGTSPYQFSLDNATWGNAPFIDQCTGSYTVYVIDDNNCTQNSPVTVFSILSPLDATINQEPAICANSSSILLSAQDPGGTWSGNGITDANLGIFDPSIATAGSIDITYTIAGTCGNSDAMTIDVIANDDVTIDQPAGVCENMSSFTVNTSMPGGTWSGTGITNINTGEFDPALAGEGVHTVYYTTSGTCPITDSVDFTVLPLLFPTITNVDTYCGLDTTITLTADISNGTWTINGNPSSGTFNPSVLGSGNHTIVYEISQQCGSVDNLDITILESPSANITLSDIYGCAPLSTTIENTVVGNNQSCVWDLGDGTLLDSCSSFTYTYNNAGCYDISLTITNQDGCTASYNASSQVCAESPPVADFNFTPEVPSEYDALVDFINESSNASTYEWFIDSLFHSSNTDTYNNFEGQDAGSHLICLVAENAANCHDTLCKEVSIAADFSIYIPNTFTPDQDGLNDEFGVTLYGEIPDLFELLIFDRWGNLFFQTDDSSVLWDGTNGAAIAPQDVYIWKIRYRFSGSAKPTDLIGHVNLLR